jgi:serine/threonine protein kinase
MSLNSVILSIVTYHTSNLATVFAQLADFGLSRILTADIYSHVITRTYGTVAYMPPEVLKTGHLARPADVWSMGMLMFEMYCGEVGALSAACALQPWHWC